MSHSFASDNFVGVHPEVMMAIQKANVGHAMAYGEAARSLFIRIFNKHNK